MAEGEWLHGTWPVGTVRKKDIVEKVGRHLTLHSEGEKHAITIGLLNPHLRRDLKKRFPKLK